MVDNQANPSPGVQWMTSPQYRIIHSNLFRHRINVGEAMFHFQTITDTGQGATVVIDEVSIAMSFGQLKALRHTIDDILDAVEREVGPVAMTAASEETISAFKEHILNTVRTVYGKQPPK